MKISALSLLCGISGAAAAGTSPISHIIVLMMENRSFDHMLGWLKQHLSPSIEGLSNGQTVPRDPNDASKGSVPITRNGYDISPDDPRHDFDNITAQINNNLMNGFVYDSISTGLNESNPVSMFDITSAPIINTLALEYAVFDQWFCSVPGPTDPNRAFAMSGTSMGVITNFNGTLWSQQSYFDYLRQNNRSFAGYYQDDLWALGYFEDTVNTDNFQYIQELEPNFYNDVAAGSLADFVWLQPRSSTYSEEKVATWQHPDASVQEGERLIKQIYEAIRAGPKWNETLFLITYDEHGGFYDHVPPPDEGVPSPDGVEASNGFAFDRLGVRIPTLAISPWIPRGTIVSDALPGEQPTPTSSFESTSILATANRILGLDDAPPLGDRMAWANTFSGVTSLSTPRDDCPVKLPHLPRADPKHWLEQRLKPLNDHMEAQLLYYCVMNEPEAYARGECSGRPEIMYNQGLASDWLLKQRQLFVNQRKH